jgi:hypothetical protein
MIPLSNRRFATVRAMWTAPLAVLAVLYTPPLPGFGAGLSWAQGTPLRSTQEFRIAQRPNRKKAVEPASPEATAAVQPMSEPTGALGVALASCDKGSESSEALVLPGAKGELKLDRCYRGRDHLVCSFNALATEAKTLTEEYTRVVDVHYPDVNNVDGVCSFKPDNLATDLQNTIDFANRFKSLKAEYNVRTSCASKIEQSLKDVTLRDMAQAPDILKSMIDAIDGDIKGISATHGKAADLAEKIEAAQKALTTMRMIHRTMCLKDQPVISQSRGSPTQ